MFGVKKEDCKRKWCRTTLSAFCIELLTMPQLFNDAWALAFETYARKKLFYQLFKQFLAQNDEVIAFQATAIATTVHLLGNEGVEYNFRVPSSHPNGQYAIEGFRYVVYVRPVADTVDVWEYYIRDQSRE